MYGYVYLTSNNINGKVYVGQKTSDEYIPTYLGSGLLIREAVEEFGFENFTNIIIDTADSKDELDEKERHYICLYKEKYGDDCYNIGSGNAGDPLKYATEERKEEFRQKMTKINKERCSKDDFKKKISKATKERYSNPEEREKQRLRSKKAWSNPELREKQSKIVKEKLSDEKVRKKISDKLVTYWSNEENKKKMSQTQKEIWTEEKCLEQSKMLKERFKDEEYLEKKRKETSNRWTDPEYKKKVSENIRKARLKESVNKGAEARKVKIKIEFNGEEIIFNSRKEFNDYFKSKYNFTIAPNTYNNLIETGEPFKAYYKKHEILNGLKIYKL